MNNPKSLNEVPREYNKKNDKQLDEELAKKRLVHLFLLMTI